MPVPPVLLMVATEPGVDDCIVIPLAQVPTAVKFVAALKVCVVPEVSVYIFPAVKLRSALKVLPAEIVASPERVTFPLKVLVDAIDAVFVILTLPLNVLVPLIVPVFAKVTLLKVRGFEELFSVPAPAVLVNSILLNTRAFAVVMVMYPTAPGNRMVDEFAVSVNDVALMLNPGVAVELIITSELPNVRVLALVEVEKYPLQFIFLPLVMMVP